MGQFNETFLLESKRSGLLDELFKSLPQDIRAPCDVAYTAANKPKNRYMNIVACMLVE